jgi:Putative transposase/Transposase zinc-binding domain
MDVGAILERHAAAAGPLTAQQRRAVADLAACRTAALGGRLEQCAACGHQHYHYNSCRNRHCPRCQAGRRAAWLEREAAHLLPVEYHHVVFTLPQALAELARRRPRLVYNLLFQAASASTSALAADPKYLGAQVGLVAVLHTWGQTLTLHPHLHVLATGGGLTCNAQGEVDAAPHWVSCRPGFFLPVRVLSRLFRGKYLAGLRQALAQGPWPVGPGLERPEDLAGWLAALARQEWVVYSQPPAAGPAVVLKYLARYVQRVAISNSRLVAVTDEAVTFTYKDYRHQGKQKELTLSGAEFARRFLRHVLPRGLVRVRHYGLLANRGREAKLACCRRLLGVAAVTAAVAPSSVPPPGRCPVCGEGVLVVVQWLPRAVGCGVGAAGREDSS